MPQRALLVKRVKVVKLEVVQNVGRVDCLRQSGLAEVLGNVGRVDHCGQNHHQQGDCERCRSQSHEATCKKLRDRLRLEHAAHQESADHKKRIYTQISIGEKLRIKVVQNHRYYGKAPYGFDTYAFGQDWYSNLNI